jgi:hypothetical protein
MVSNYVLKFLIYSQGNYEKYDFIFQVEKDFDKYSNLEPNVRVFFAILNHVNLVKE